jgi:hypothetical protein
MEDKPQTLPLEQNHTKYHLRDNCRNFNVVHTHNVNLLINGYKTCISLKLSYSLLKLFVCADPEASPGKKEIGYQLLHGVTAVIWLE